MQKISRMLLIPLLMFSLFASAQTRKISGKVVGNNNEPVAGASISVKGSSAGASANNEGKFYSTHSLVGGRNQFNCAVGEVCDHST